MEVSGKEEKGVCYLELLRSYVLLRFNLHPSTCLSVDNLHFEYLGLVLEEAPSDDMNPRKRNTSQPPLVDVLLLPRKQLVFPGCRRGGSPSAVSCHIWSPEVRPPAPSRLVTLPWILCWVLLQLSLVVQPWTNETCLLLSPEHK